MAIRAGTVPPSVVYMAHAVVGASMTCLSALDKVDQATNARRLHKEWHLFIDDLAVGTGKKGFVREGPTNVHDVMELLDRAVQTWPPRKYMPASGTDGNHPFAHNGDDEQQSTPAESPRDMAMPVDVTMPADTHAGKRASTVGRW